MDHQGRAQLARVDDALHLGVAPVIAAHEADLQQALAVGDLGGDDLLAVGGVLGERLLAEDELAVLQALEDVARMGRVGRGDDDRLDLGRGDQLLAGLVDGQAVLRGHLLGSRLEIVGAGDDLAAGHQLNQTADVVAADRAAADNTNFQHRFSPFHINI